jgi:NADPH:quinone reductase-like Zn-dependent oxidoreductase
VYASAGAGGEHAKAAVYHRFGSPDVLELQDIDQPALTDDRVLVRVRASSVNPAEWYAVTGRPDIARPAMGLRRPKQTVPGADFAGTVEAVGGAVTDLRPGDAGHRPAVRAGRLPAALRYLGEGHARAKVVITV